MQDAATHQLPFCSEHIKKKNLKKQRKQPNKLKYMFSVVIHLFVKMLFVVSTIQRVLTAAFKGLSAFWF